MLRNWEIWLDAVAVMCYITWDYLSDLSLPKMLSKESQISQYIESVGVYKEKSS